MLDTFREALIDGTIHIPNENIMDDEVVKVHLYQSLFQGVIVDVVTDVPEVPTIPVAKSKLANTLKFDPPIICA